MPVQSHWEALLMPMHSPELVVKALRLPIPVLSLNAELQPPPMLLRWLSRAVSLPPIPVQ
jgi:hypothetical protein